MLECDQVCPDIQVAIQGHSFAVTFHLLQISGADAVLGIDWLKKPGPVTTYYTTFVMHFNHLGQDISLKADVTIGPEPTSVAQLKCLIHTGSTSVFYHLSLVPERQPEQTTTQHPISSIANLLL